MCTHGCYEGPRNESRHRHGYIAGSCQVSATSCLVPMYLDYRNHRVSAEESTPLPSGGREGLVQEIGKSSTSADHRRAATPSQLHGKTDGCDSAEKPKDGTTFRPLRDWNWGWRGRWSNRVTFWDTGTNHKADPWPLSYLSQLPGAC